MMKTYRSFEEYIYENYYDPIYNKVKGFLCQKNGTAFFSTNLIPNATSFEFDDYHIAGVTFKTIGGDALHFRLSINADVNVYGKSRYDYESDAKSIWVSVYCESILKNGLHNFKIVRVEEYSKDKFDKESSLDHYLVPYLYNEDADEVAENFLRDHCQQALQTAMPLPVQDVVRDMGMQLYFAPLNDTIFGKTYFVTTTVTVYKDDSYSETEDITVPPGTMLVNPNVFFMYNIGTMNNTIIHECVHWKRHKMFFELMRLLNQEYRFISCEIVEAYGKEKAKSTPLEWIEWQANTLAPKILMPASTTKKYIQDRLHDLRQSMPASTRDAEVMAQAILDTAAFFQVSRIAAKLRAIELGFEQAHGTFVYIEGKTIPHFSFGSKIIGKNGSFVVDSISALRMIITHPVLDALYAENKIVFVNNMLCINAPKYIRFNDKEHPEMTQYALDHVDECCFLFTCKKRIKLDYDDSFYRACFLCREITADSLLEAEYDAELAKNQLTEEEAAAIAEIVKLSQQYESDFDELPGSFHKTVDYHITRKGLTAETLSGRSNISTQTISELRNKTNKNVTIPTLLKLFIGLNLNKEYCYDLMRKAGVDFPNTMEGRFYRWLVDEHTDETIERWQRYLDQAKINVTLCNLDS
ncbi:MAG TPA: helix-turn-helix transcriptional regulator [Ruminococcus sp.]|nr:helix-turn-helix transcriptional regulator [Ruminococcus sp.]